MTRICIIVLPLVLAGCASNAERRAFDRWIEAGAGERRLTMATSQSAEGDASPVTMVAPTGLEGYIRHALEHNPALVAVRQDWKAALEKVPQARGMPDPRLMYRWDSMEQEHGAGVAQGIILPPKLDARAAVALERARVFEHRHRAAQRELIQQIKDAYAEYAYIHQAIEVTGENLAITRSLEDAATALYRAGKTTQADIPRAQVELERIENDLVTLQSLIEPLVARLNALMGRDVRATLPPPAALQLPAADLGDEHLIQWMKSHNPELAASQQEAVAARRAVRAARLENLPDLELGLEYMTDPMEEGVGVTTGITLPLWREKYDALKREALAEFGAATARQADLRNQLAQQLTMAVYELRDAQRRVSLFAQRLIPKARNALDATQAGYRADQLQLNDVLIARRDLLDLQLAHHRAVADLHQSLARIEKLIGAPLDQLSTPQSSNPAAAPGQEQQS